MASPRLTILLWSMMMMAVSVARAEDSNESIMDRIIKMISRMEKMDNKVDKLVNAVEIMVGKQVETDKRMTKVEGKMEQLIKDVPFFLPGWKFLGHGLFARQEQSVTTTTTTIATCGAYCEEVRRAGGPSWNGMSWKSGENGCYCHKNDEGHDAQFSQWVHYRIHV